MTIHEALNSAIALLRQREDIAEWASRDANILLQHILQVTRTHLLAHPECALTQEQQDAYDKLIQRRLLAEPIQHLTGKQEFYGRQFIVTPDVLIPRPETELIIDTAKQKFDTTTALRIADVGTGSGVLAVTLALEFPNATVTALDISLPALEIAKQNALQLYAKNIQFVQSDLLDAVDEEPFDLIVSNPPYIAESDRETLHEQVRAYEPPLALFAGEDGNSIYRRLVSQAWQHLRPGGWLIMEQGTQGGTLAPLFEKWTNLEFIEDLQGIPRTVTAHRSA